jgi:hypothetical protein
MGIGFAYYLSSYLINWERRQPAMPLRAIILVLLILILIGSLPVYPYSAGWGYYPAGGLGTVLIILLILFLLGVI